MKFTKKEIQDIIAKEVKWCEEANAPTLVPEDFRRGFITGLKQASLLIDGYAKAVKQSC